MEIYPISEAIENLSHRFSAHSDTPSLDAQVLIAHIVNRPRSWVLAHPEKILSVNEINAIDVASSKIETGIPLPYVLGSWEFFGQKFFVTPDVLIPRPETELLMEKALGWMDERLKTQSQNSFLLGDIGCGSGCIGISLALHYPNTQIVLSDVSLAALNVAAHNAAYHHVTSHLTIIQCDLIPPLSKQFDLVCANLPYIPTNTLSQLKIYQKEPRYALDGGRDGLEIIRRLLIDTPNRLAIGGMLLLEIESNQGESASQFARAAFPEASIELFQDLAGHDRLISIQQGK